MKINEFIEMYRKNRNINLKKVLEVKEYISVAHKQKIAELVLDSSLVEEDGILQINSLDRYLLFTIAVISMHTNLEFSTDDEDDDHSSLDDFDMLCENGLLEKILDTFREDYNACQIVLDMMTSDMVKNYETLEKKILRFLNNIPDNIQKNFDSLENKNEILELISSIIEE